jgi:hypothetical protein
MVLRRELASQMIAAEIATNPIVTAIAVISTWP